MEQMESRDQSSRCPGPPGTVPDAVIEQLREDILEEVMRELKLICPGNRVTYPATSCTEIHNCNPNSSSGYSWRKSSPPELMYCAMNLTRCGSTTAWRVDKSGTHQHDKPRGDLPFTTGDHLLPTVMFTCWRSWMFLCVLLYIWCSLHRGLWTSHWIPAPLYRWLCGHEY